MLRRGHAGPTRPGAPGGLLPLECVPRLPHVPGLGPARGGAGPLERPSRCGAADRGDSRSTRLRTTDEATAPRRRRLPMWRPVTTTATIEDDDDLWATPRHEAETPVQRNPPRDWAAPPPWATGGAAGSTSGGSSSSGSAGSGRGAGGSGGSTASGGSGERPPEFLASRSASAGLVGSSADRLASGQPISASPVVAAVRRPGRPRRAGCRRGRAVRGVVATAADPAAERGLPDHDGVRPASDRQLHAAARQDARPRRSVLGERQALRGLSDDQDPGRPAGHPADPHLGRRPWASPRSRCSSCRTSWTSVGGGARAERQPVGLARGRRPSRPRPRSRSRRRRPTRSRRATPSTRSRRSST